MAVNDSFSSSAIAQLEGAGYDVLLFLNATIAIMKRDEAPVSMRARPKGRFESGFNLEDVQFLKSMHISVNR